MRIEPQGLIQADVNYASEVAMAAMVWCDAGRVIVSQYLALVLTVFAILHPCVNFLDFAVDWVNKGNWFRGMVSPRRIYVVFL